MVNPVVDSAFILAKVEVPSPAQQNHVNKSKLPGAGPVKVDMDILMQRCEKSRKQKQKDRPEAPKNENGKGWSWEKLDSRLAKSPSQELPSDKLAAMGPSAEVKPADDSNSAIIHIVSIAIHILCLHQWIKNESILLCEESSAFLAVVSKKNVRGYTCFLLAGL